MARLLRLSGKGGEEGGRKTLVAKMLLSMTEMICRWPPVASLQGYSSVMVTSDYNRNFLALAFSVRLYIYLD